MRCIGGDKRERAPAEAAAFLLSDICLRPARVPGRVVREEVREVVVDGRGTRRDRIGETGTPRGLSVTVRQFDNGGFTLVEPVSERVVTVERAEGKNVYDAIEKLERATGSIRRICRMS